MNIHLVEPLNHFVNLFVNLKDNIWESGWWKLDEDKAKKFVGREIYFHKSDMNLLFMEEPYLDIGSLS